MQPKVALDTPYAEAVYLTGPDKSVTEPARPTAFMPSRDGTMPASRGHSRSSGLRQPPRLGLQRSTAWCEALRRFLPHHVVPEHSGRGHVAGEAGVRAHASGGEEKFARVHRALVPFLRVRAAATASYRKCRSARARPKRERGA